MLFASFDFLIFFAVAFTGYWLLSRRAVAQALLVTVGSYFFYMAGPKPVDGWLPTPWYFVGLLLLSTLVDFYCGKEITRARCALSKTKEAPLAKDERAGGTWLALSLVANLGLLGYFKYTGFLFEAAEDISAAFGGVLSLPALQLALPIGISFYTFQSLSYTIDVYRGRLQAESSLLSFACFVAFFPQLVAGPIVRASEFLPQLKARRSLSSEDVDAAVWRITKGLLKKVVLGDFIAVYFADIVFATPGEHSSLENLVALYAFTLQIYADFSGYSDIAIGVARLLGFTLPENFERPYQATDVADFWRRWHMTLSRWLRDYLYYPLGGSRVSSTRSYVNLWLTMFLVGMWHGASWNFVIYSNLQAAAMLFNRFVKRRESNRKGHVQLLTVSLVLGGLFAWLCSRVLLIGSFELCGAGVTMLCLAIGYLPSSKEAERWRPVHIFLTLHFSVFSRVFFRSEDLGHARAMIGKLISVDGLGVRSGMFRIQGLSLWLEQHSVLSFAKPLAEWGILLILLAGFAIHYVPSAKVEAAAARFIPRVPGIVLGVSLAMILALLSILLSGPRANIYFAF